MVSRLILPVLTGVVITSALGILIWSIKKYKKRYVTVAKVKKLYFFPIKSLKGFEVCKLECTSAGVKYMDILDREFMLISNDGVLLSMRQEPSLALLTVSFVENVITVSDKNGSILNLDVRTFLKGTGNIIKCRVHKTTVEALDCGDEAANYFNAYLERTDVRLVRYVPDISRRNYFGKEAIFKKLTNNCPFGFQDTCPVHILTQSSLDVLNSKTDETITVFNFRPNILTEGSAAFDEDNWKHIKFSSGAILDSLLPCSRCILTTVNPETGIKTNADPLKTLRKFRMLKDPELSRILEHAPCFGLYCWVNQSGFISVGDEVFAVIQKGYVEYKNAVKN